MDLKQKSLLTFKASKNVSPSLSFFNAPTVSTPILNRFQQVFIIYGLFHFLKSNVAKIYANKIFPSDITAHLHYELYTTSGGYSLFYESKVDEMMPGIS